MEKQPDCEVWRFYKEARPSDENAESLERLRALLAISEDHFAKRGAAFAEHSALEDGEEVQAIDDNLLRIECALIKARASNAADILAKLAVYNREPDMFESAPAEGPESNLLQSVVRDLPSVLGETAVAA